MPIYEFYCSDCHRIFHFLSRRVRPEARPGCPRCARPGLVKRPASFAISRGLAEPGEVEDPGDTERLEHAMASLEREAGKIDEDDPRQAAALVRRLYDAAGLPLGSRISDALARLEAGEDPDSVEADLGDELEGDVEDGLPGPEGPGRVGRLRRRLLPPSVDPELHEL